VFEPTGIKSPLLCRLSYRPYFPSKDGASGNPKPLNVPDQRPYSRITINPQPTSAASTHRAPPTRVGGPVQIRPWA